MDVEKSVPMKKDTIFRMASMSKAVTSVAAVMLMEEGQAAAGRPGLEVPAGVQVDDRPRAGTAGSGRYGSVPAKREITIRDLLTHTAGISYGDGPARSDYKAAGVLSDGTSRTGPSRSCR